MNNILVVDDDREIVESISIFLQAEGYNVIEAYDGLEALDKALTGEVHFMTKKATNFSICCFCYFYSLINTNGM